MMCQLVLELPHLTQQLQCDDNGYERLSEGKTGYEHLLYEGKQLCRQAGLKQQGHIDSWLENKR